MASPIQIDLLSPGDDILVEQLVRVINDAYAAGEAGLWIAGTARTTPQEVAELIRSGGMLAATAAGRVVGCACVRPLDGTRADLGFVSADPQQWGSGVGRRLVDAAEELMRSRGVTTMELKLLVPHEAVHPLKDRVRAWYSRRGYRPVRSMTVEEVAGDAAAELVTPCEFLVLRKPLIEPTG
jgi:GNAT superfamily N-acetyltransferase